jgi:NADH dehydrogenase [ubiquinone] 1 alpha subcomplex assembly factor 5
MNMVAEPFDRVLRRRRRDRSAPVFCQADFLKSAISDEILERVRLLGRPVSRLLDLGCHDGRLGRMIAAEWRAFADSGFVFARAAGGVMCDEDRLPFADGSFDLIVSAASLHGVNDLPGALIQIRRALRPGGTFIAGFVAGRTLATLHHALVEAESSMRSGASPRVHPMVNPAEAAGLLQRAGFVDPVADVDALTVRYADIFALLRDLRASGETSILNERDLRPVGRAVAAEAAHRFGRAADAGGKVPVEVELLYLAGRAPAPSR